jgi:hypothetical protein
VEAARTRKEHPKIGEVRDCPEAGSVMELWTFGKKSCKQHYQMICELRPLSLTKLAFSSKDSAGSTPVSGVPKAFF